jgi:hypothetical protein
VTVQPNGEPNPVDRDLLEQEVRQIQRLYRVKLATLAIVTLLLAVVVAGGGLLLYKANQTADAIRGTQLKGSPLQRRIDRVARQIKSCVDPQGSCFRQGQRRTAKAIVGINQGTLRVVVAALSCQADGITDREALARCTVDRSTR